ncbi:hypothetical protein GCM10022213_01130 [Parerythrobacter jejuensis]
MWKAIVSATVAWGLALFVSIAVPTAPAQAAMSCGGLNQKTCISINPAKRCKGSLVEKRQSGRNICVRPTQSRPNPAPADNCGGLNQKTCVSFNPARRCKGNLVEKRQSGRNICVRPSQVEADCGGLNQKTCVSLNPARRCKGNLVEKRQSGRNICVRPSQVESDCGGLNQKTCVSLNPARRCKSGLVEQRQSGRNICVRPSQLETDCGGLDQKTCVNLNPARRCKSGLVEQRQSGRNICVRPSQLERDCGGLNEKTCVSLNPARRCDAGLSEQRLYGRNICVRPEDVVEKNDSCGGLGQATCISANPLKWCDKGLVQKRQPGRNICIEKVTNADRLEVAKSVIEDLGEDNPLARLTQCLGQPSKIGRLRTAMTDRSRFGISALLTECNASISELANMGTDPTLGSNYNPASTRGASGNPSGFFKTLHITAGGSGAAWVAGTASAGYVIELVSNPNGRWYFTGGLGTGPKAEVVGDVTLALSRSDIPTGGFGLDHGTSAVVSGHYVVGLSGGVAFVGNTLDFDGISFGVGGGLGAGGAVYKNGSVFPFPDL